MKISSKILKFRKLLLEINFKKLLVSSWSLLDLLHIICGNSIGT